MTKETDINNKTMAEINTQILYIRGELQDIEENLPLYKLNGGYLEDILSKTEAAADMLYSAMYIPEAESDIPEDIEDIGDIGGC